MSPNRQLGPLVAGLSQTALSSAEAARLVGAVRDDSRAVAAGDLFVAVPGVAADGRRFVSDALARGAAAVVCERHDDDGALLDEVARAGAVLVIVDDARRALAEIAHRHHGVAAALTLTAITGTNGKTTTTHLCEAMLQRAGRVPGLIGTVEYRLPGKRVAAPLTTPGALALHALFADMRSSGCTDVVLEASSHALHQKRLHGLRFKVAALTNVTQDHLDYHRTMEAYFDAKAILFESLLAEGGVAVIHGDRADGRAMGKRVRGTVLTVPSAPREGGALDVRAHRVALDGAGLRATLATPIGALEIESALVGDYNFANVMLAVGAGLAHGLSADDIARGIAAVPGVPGRLEPVPNALGVLCVVDYAHTPDALERALGALRPLCSGRLVTVFGCGGDRDPTKRAPMGRVAAVGSDVAIVTSDNPRTEAPARIIDMVVEGVAAAGLPRRSADDVRGGAAGYVVEPDRRAAIELAVNLARPDDVLLIAGKGHEDYQILGTTKIHFDDREEAARALAARTGASA